ncbi:MAG: PaaI family thioesterase [Pseudomonadota bacterium]
MQFAATQPWNDTGVGISSVIPMRLIEAKEGEVTLRAKADERHTNPLGAVHGGFAATVLDGATGCAVHTTLPPGQGYGTIDLNVKMMRPVPQHVELTAIGNVINKSRNLVVAEASLRDDTGKLYAHATATCMMISDSQA